jgi:hypothetical protein
MGHRSISATLRAAIAGQSYRVATLAKVDAGIVRRFELGKRGLSIESVDRLCRALGLRLTHAKPARRRGPKRASRPPVAESEEPPNCEG